MMSKRKFRSLQAIDVIDAAYQLEKDEVTWLADVASTICPLFEGHGGLLAYEYDFDIPPARWLQTRVEMSYEHQRLYMGMFESPQTAGLVEMAHARTPEPLEGAIAAARAQGVELAALPLVASTYQKLGIIDAIAIRTVEVGNRGVAFVTGSLREARFDRQTRRLWARIAAHVAAARRLRRALAESKSTVDAVLTPAGRIEHAEGETASRSARDALREAVRHRERALARKHRDDPATTIEAWTALVSGRWSLVDQYERGGRRYLIARRNELSLRDLRALTPREHVVARLAALGKSNKLIAYELGLGISTIGTHLAAVMRKLGVASRVELIHLLASLE